MIRKMKEEDLCIAVDICQQCFVIEGYEYDVEKEFRGSFTNTTTIEIEYYVFEEDGMIKGVGGLTNCGFDDDVFGLSVCYVHPLYQGQGIGKRLLDFRIERIKELGGQIIFSTTKKMWHLQRCGFEEIKSPYKEWHLMQLIIG